MEQLKYKKKIFKDFKLDEYVYIYTDNAGACLVVNNEVDVLDSYNPEDNSFIELEDYGYVRDLMQILESE